jgi:zinc protease
MIFMIPSEFEEDALRARELVHSRFGPPLVMAIAALATLTVPGRGGAAPTSGGGEEMPQITFEKYTLPNGLQVILHIDRKLPVVHVNQWYHVGSKNEEPRRTGFAHLFEHLMFQGSKNVPGEYFTIVENAGANLREGGVNGTTDTDRTNFFATVPSGNLETLLWIESDRLATLGDALTQEKLDNQRDVVKNERRQGLENQPYGRWHKIITENLFPQGHPYAHTVIGSHEDLTAATLDDAKNFFKQFYAPNNLSLVIAGDFDPAEAKRLVEKYYGPIPAGQVLDRPKRWIPVIDGERVIECADRVPQERVYMAWPAPELFGEGQHALDLASTVLADGLSSRLNKALVYDRKVCSDVSAFSWTMEIAGAFVIIATARPGASLSDIESGIAAEIKRLATKGPTAEEINRAKTKNEYAYVHGLERLGGFGGKADRLNMYNTYLGDPAKFEEDLARTRAVTPADMRAAVSHWLDNPNHLTVRFHPETSSRAVASDLDRTKQPALGSDRPFLAPDVQAGKLPNGMDVLVVERHELPMVSVTLTTRAGTAADPAGKEGCAELTARCMDLGTKTRKALAIEDALGDLGTGIGVSAGRENANATMSVLKRNLPAALAIASDVVQNPTFPPDEVERERALLLDDIAQESNDPNAVAGRVRAMLAFGREHPYGRPATGTRQTVEPLKSEDLAAFHAARWKPGSSAIVFAGDITLAEALDLAKQSFGNWAGGVAPSIPIPPPAPMGQGKVYIVDRQGAAQTVVSQILPAPKRDTPDYYSLRVADAVWGGGGFGTRLNLNLREDKGYSYGVFSALIQFKESGIWRAAGGVQTDKTKESVVEFSKELKALAGERPITADELANAKSKFIRGYSQGFENLGQIGGEVAGLWSMGLPMTEMKVEPEKVGAVTLSEANAVAKKYAVPSQATYLLVGDRAKIEAGVKDLGLGPVVVLDEEGRSLASAAVR